MTVVLSGPSVITYSRCHLLWWFIHVAAMETEPPEAQVVDLEVLEHSKWRLKGEEVVRRLDPTVEPLAEVFDRDILPTYGKPVLIDEPFQISVHGVPFSGAIASLDRHDTSWGPEHLLRDVKTIGSKSDTHSVAYGFAMTGCYVGVTEGLAYSVTVMQLDWIARTKKPYYFPLVVPNPDKHQIGGWAATIEITADAIARRDFHPTGLGTDACDFCDFRDICGPFQRFQGDRSRSTRSAKPRGS